MPQSQMPQSQMPLFSDDTGPNPALDQNETVVDAPLSIFMAPTEKDFYHYIYPDGVIAPPDYNPATDQETDKPTRHEVEFLQAPRLTEIGDALFKEVDVLESTKYLANEVLYRWVYKTPKKRGYHTAGYIKRLDRFSRQESGHQFMVVLSAEYVAAQGYLNWQVEATIFRLLLLVMRDGLREIPVAFHPLEMLRYGDWRYELQLATAATQAIYGVPRDPDGQVQWKQRLAEWADNQDADEEDDDDE